MSGLHAISFPTVPAVRVRRTTNQSFTTAVAAAHAFDAEEYDTHGMHSTSANTERLTCVAAGIYLIQGQVFWNTNSTGARILRVRLNGTTDIARVGITNAGASDGTAMQIVTTWNMAVTDYVELMGYQASGGNLDSLTDSSDAPWFSAVRIG